MFKIDFRKSAALFAVAIALAVVATVLLFPNEVMAFAAGGSHSALFTASAVLIALRSEHSDLVAKAAAKIAEVKSGLAADVVARIETDHAALVRDAKAVEAKITAEEARIAAPPPAAKPWAEAFYLSAADSGLQLADINKIVLASTSHEAAKDALITAMAAAQNAGKPGAGGNATVTVEASQKFVAGVTSAILAKIPMLRTKKGKLPEGAEHNEFSAYSMRELARMSLEIRGMRNIPRDPMQMIASAFAPVFMAGAASTSDFANILANIANKSLLKGYEEAPETFQVWTGTGILTDFKPAKAVDLGLFPSLSQVDEGAEYSYASMSDRGVTRMLATYGKMFPITRQAVINDDLSAFTKIPAKMGNAAKRTIGNLVYAVLTSNANAPDGVALFHAATHKNLATGGGSAISATSLDAGRAAMGRQTDPDNIKQGLNISPAYCLVPKTLQGTANQIFASQAEPGQENPAVANRVANMAEVVAESRLDVASTAAWYLAANPNQYDTLDVEYLNGVQAPVLEQREGWNVDGLEFKVRIDAGVTLKDFRGFYKGAGS